MVGVAFEEPVGLALEELKAGLFEVGKDRLKVGLLAVGLRAIPNISSVEVEFSRLI